MQAPGYEQRLAFGLPVGETSLMEAHIDIVGSRREKSHIKMWSKPSACETGMNAGLTQAGTNLGLANRRFAPQ